ncbi:hypothetical protein E2C01_094157 [Portunus trituberculatus]|uniref:Uncharacterized protein n=1 Tax=Portunus trituberculatus TaxID=210409 RepID=A0A5B7JWV3_PORTR|nr:hypothetical protein [Portunus trituberculatus]
MELSSKHVVIFSFRFQLFIHSFILPCHLLLVFVFIGSSSSSSSLLCCCCSCCCFHTLPLSTDYSGRCYDAERCSLRTTGETWTVDSTCEQATCMQASNGTLLEKRIREWRQEDKVQGRNVGAEWIKDTAKESEGRKEGYEGVRLGGGVGD